MAVGQHKAKISIEAEVANAVKKIKNLEKQVKGLEKQLTKSAKAAKEATASLEGMLTGAAIIQGVKTLDDLVNKSIKFENVMGNLKFPIDGARKATQGLISDFDLARAAVSASSLGVAKSEQDFAKLSKAAVALGSKLGIDTPQAMEQLTTAVGRGSRMILDNFGIIAEGFESMSMEERLALIENAMKDTTFTVSEGAKEWARLKNDLDNLINDAMPAFVKVAGFAAGEVRDLTDAIMALKDATGESGFQIENMLPTMEESLDLWIELQKPILGVAGYLDNFTESSDTATISLRRQAVAVQNLGKQFKGLLGGRRQMSDKEQEQFNKTFGIDQGEDALEQGPLLGAKASDFKKKGRGGKKKSRFEKTAGRGDLSTFGFKAEDHLSDILDTPEASLSDEDQLAAMERQLELMQARQESQAALFDQEIAIAEFRGNEHEAEVLRLERTQALFEEQEKRKEKWAKEEKKRQADLLRKRKEDANAYGSLANSTADIIELAGARTGASEEKVAKIAAFAKGLKAAATGAQITAEGIADIASQNYPKGAAEIAAGIVNFAVAGALFAGNVGAAQGAASGGASLSGSSRPPGTGFGGPGTGTGAGTNERPGSNIPGSPNGTPPNGTQGGMGAKQGNVITIHKIDVTGSIDDESAEKIKKGLQNLDYSGKVSA